MVFLQTTDQAAPCLWNAMACMVIPLTLRYCHDGILTNRGKAFYMHQLKGCMLLGKVAHQQTVQLERRETAGICELKIHGNSATQVLACN